ncbi:MAG: hypothetical protein JKY54_02085 [Flavobacteriales bacterium]|nr:hypothetical protein [Flavobacteriales bacterium]
MRKIGIIILLAVLLSGCAKTAIEVSIINTSGETLNSVIVSTRSGRSLVEFTDLKDEESATNKMHMYKELEADGDYFVNVPQLELKSYAGYYTNGSPTEDKMMIVITPDSIKVNFSFE